MSRSNLAAMGTPAHDDGSPPFFIVGADRSGTTLLVLMLDRHPEVAIPSEGHFIPLLWRQRRRYGADDRIENLVRLLHDLLSHPSFRYWNLPAESIRRELGSTEPPEFAVAIAAAYAAFARSQGKTRWGDKTPEYVSHIPLLATLFPEARFVHMIRDPRDVALSTLDLNRLHRRAATSAFLWARKIRSAREAEKWLGSGRYHEVRYEALVSDPRIELQRLADFLSLPFDERMLDHDPQSIERIPPRMRHMHSRLALPLTTGLRDWRTQMSPSDLVEVEAIAGAEMEATGYPRTMSGRSAAARARAYSRLAGFAVRYGRLKVRRVIDQRVRRSASANRS
jgi:hypothetical protein